MSGSAFEQLEDLMAMIDDFENNLRDQSRAPSSLQSHHHPPSQPPPSSQQQPSATNNLPPFLMNTHIPIDVAFRPEMPCGHTPYSWSYSNAFIQPKATSPPKHPQRRAAEQSKGKNTAKRKAPAKGKKGKMGKAGKAGKHGHAAGAEEKQSTERRDFLIGLEKAAQSEWDRAKLFESDPVEGAAKFFVTFPYPYSNGFFHLGHAFTISKAEFRAGYERLKGKNVLFPFAFHCTGMPIAAAAKKLSAEIERFGNPPVFPQHHDLDAAALKHGHGHGGDFKKSTKKYQWEIMKEFGFGDDEIPAFRDPLRWLEHFPPIGERHLRALGLKVDWRRSFITTEANPYYSKFIEWQFLRLRAAEKIEFGNRPSIFSPSEQQPCADHDRSSGEGVGPQQYTLIKMRLLTDEKALDIPVIRKNGDVLSPLYAEGRPIYLVAATLRPETMYGQTNCFVLPRGKYVAISVTKGGGRGSVYLCSEHSARNMAWQSFTAQRGEYEVLQEVEGWDLLGRSLEAPHAVYERVHVLPLNTIKMGKGTGIVTSVPSDAPADYAALRDAQKDEAFRAKHYLTEDMVAPFEVVPIISISVKRLQVGDLEIADFDTDRAAVDLCERCGVKSQNDALKLEEIKKAVYKHGFAAGTMLVGDFEGERVSAAKEKVRRQLIAKGLADDYWEPEEEVMSRTNSRCVVAFCDQWFLKYGVQDPDDVDSKSNEWQQSVKRHIEEGLECYTKETHDNFMRTIEWLHSWACSREFGLGTALPWDTKWVIESLSDSTIYMAFYCVAHHLLAGKMDGDAERNPIRPEDLTPALFDAVFCGGDLDAIDWAKSSVDIALARRMRKEFEYWYPLDLRVSGKDLIFNHLTMALYNHAAIWPGQSQSRWPQSYWTNGWVLLNGEKMSKNAGNFLTIEGTVKEFGADATRFCLANAGDTLEDANFETEVANAAILSLFRFQQFVEHFVATKDSASEWRPSDAPLSEMDSLFWNAMDAAINATDAAYSAMRFREVLKCGFHKLHDDGHYYLAHCDGGKGHCKVVERYIEVAVVMLSPICPHLAEHIWRRLLRRESFCANASWPEAAEEDVVKSQQFESLQKVAHEFRNDFNSDAKDRRRKMKKAKKGSKTEEALRRGVNGATVCVADEYQPYHRAVLEALHAIYDEKKNELSEGDQYKAYLLRAIGVGRDDKKENEEAAGGGAKKKGKKKRAKLTKEQQAQLQFAAYLVKEVMPERGRDTFNQTLPYDEFAFLQRHKKLLFHGIDEVDLERVTFYKRSDPDTPDELKGDANPGRPSVKFGFFE